MKKIMLFLFLLISVISCDFLENPPALGLSDNKLTDLPSMRALINGAFDEGRSVLDGIATIDIPLVRDMRVRNKPENDGFFEHRISYDIRFKQSYKILQILNLIDASEVMNMEGSLTNKQSILGDMHFLRALIYFQLNTHYELPSTGYSVPLVLHPVEVGEKVSCARSEDIKKQIEIDIEAARDMLNTIQGELVNYYIATALAARIYFYHEKYDKAYSCADEVINSNKYFLGSIEEPFIPSYDSNENIFNIIYNPLDQRSPVKDLYTCLQASEAIGSYVLYENGELANLFDNEDVRFKTFFVKQDGVIYGSNKYSTDQMHFPYIRLPEMYLTRAEANIMKSDRVAQQDVDDVNKIISRAIPSANVTSIPDKSTLLEILYQERTKELALEVGDHFLNIKRLKRGIVRIPQEGEGLKPYSEYADQVISIFPSQEELYHGLNRKP